MPKGPHGYCRSQKYQLGRRCLQKLLITSRCKVRILTKNAAVKGDFDIIARYADRVELSLSLTAPPSNADALQVLELNASPIEERVDALRAAKPLGITIYGILCPSLPGIGNTPDAFAELLDITLSLAPTAIWTEPVNPRGPGLKNCEDIVDPQSKSIRSGKSIFP